METGLKKFVVFKANIMDEDGRKRKDGEIVVLGPKLARHYGKLGFLRPHFEEGEDDDDTEDDEEPVSKVGAAQAKLARSRRVSSKPYTSEVPEGSSEK